MSDNLHNSTHISYIGQLDGNESVCSNDDQDFKSKIPVHISKYREKVRNSLEPRIAVRKAIKRNNIVLQGLELPTVINLNPRSIYNKSEELKILIEQYNGDVICISESWERENFSLSQLLQLENYKVISNVKQREFVGGKPAIIINQEKYHIKDLCPDPITVPIGVEAVWALITHKDKNPRSKVKYIAIASIYYRGPKSTKKQELFDHIANTYHYLCSKYGNGIDFIIAGDTNRLNLSPILNLSPNLQQVVKVPTRLSPARILDPIITTLKKYYCEPVTKPPIEADQNKSGKPSDHLVVLFEPYTATLEIPPRVYKTVESRPINFEGLMKFSTWVENHNWVDLYKCQGVDKKAELLQNLLVEKYLECFPVKICKVSCEDKPWITSDIKKLDRKRKREFSKHHKSELWKKLDSKFVEKCKKAKDKYYSNIVSDLKESNPGQWHSKVKRMSGNHPEQSKNIQIDQLNGYSDKDQSNIIADHYAKISNQYDPVSEDDFPEFKNKQFCPPVIEPYQVYKAILSMNKKAAAAPGDIPMRLIYEFSVELATPLAHVYNECLIQGQYPDMYKSESVTPVPKFYPPEQLRDLRKISGLLNCAKLFDKLIGEYMIFDMAPKRDPAQYGNEKKLSIQHYVIKMLHRILTAVDRNNQSEAFAVIIGLVDWSQAFDRQCHIQGIQSFLDNGVRKSLIPILISYFQNRRMKVKWNGKESESKPVNGGGAQGGLLGILEYLSQSNDCASFLSEKDRYKFIDDLSILELINLVSIGLSSYNLKQQVPSDIQASNMYIPPINMQTQKSLDKICDWTKKKKMLINPEKTKYMIVNFTKNYQFSTRLNLEGKLIQQINQTRLLGIIVDDSLTWQSNTNHIVKQAYKRMTILQNLFKFSVPLEDLIMIYILYIRSVVENSAVVWHSSLTQGQVLEIERIQKVALRIILKNDYISYENALEITSLPTLSERRLHLCKKFAEKCTRNPKTSDIFPLNSQGYNTRNPEKYQVTYANTSRLARSSIPFMQKLLNAQ